LKQAGVMLVVKDGLILAISRRYDKNIFGLPGGSKDRDDLITRDTAIRECEEETGIKVKDCVFLYKRVELGDGDQPTYFESDCFYATQWEGTPTNIEEGEVKWLTAEQLTCTAAAFGDYNRQMLNEFKKKFPDIQLIGE
jgi:8-oxo-dGTP pyrophosphatase MutT (NUDIX family)